MPRADPVESKGEVPSHTEIPHGLIKTLAKLGFVFFVRCFAVLQANSKDVPEHIDLLTGPFLGIGEKPGLLIVENRYAIKAVRNVLLDVEEQ